MDVSLRNVNIIEYFIHDCINGPALLNVYNNDKCDSNLSVKLSQESSEYDSVIESQNTCNILNLRHIGIIFYKLR